MSALKLVLTRPQGQNESWCTALQELGHSVNIHPLTAYKLINPTELPLALDKFEGIFFSSVQGWSSFWQWHKDLPPGLSYHLQNLPTCSLSNQVSLLAERQGKPLTRLTESQTLTELAVEARLNPLPGMFWLHPCSEQTRLNPEIFFDLGLKFFNLPLYTSEPLQDEARILYGQLSSMDAIVFAAGSAASCWCTFLEENQLTSFFRQNAAKPAFWGLGPSVKEVLDKYELPCILAPQPNLEGVLALCEEFFRSPKKK